MSTIFILSYSNWLPFGYCAGFLLIFLSSVRCFLMLGILSLSIYSSSTIIDRSSSSSWHKYLVPFSYPSNSLTSSMSRMFGFPISFITKLLRLLYPHVLDIMFCPFVSIEFLKFNRPVPLLLSLLSFLTMLELTIWYCESYPFMADSSRSLIRYFSDESWELLLKWYPGLYISLFLGFKAESASYLYIKSWYSS